ncbi:MAG: hypothetical protein D3903_00560 [Candidatus Electrothrix sp. GM3_4]|nr:hypothetical protein [Candidatus Electrothrix sp. GM3_4]
MSNLIWLVFIFLMAVLVISVLWLILRLRQFSQSHNYTVIDDKLLQNMLGDEALSKELKSALVGKTPGAKYPGSSSSTPTASAAAKKRAQAGPDKKRSGQGQSNLRKNTIRKSKT